MNNGYEGGGSVDGMKAILRVFRDGSIGAPPVWLMRQAGRYLPEYRAVRAKAGSFLDLCYSPELAAEVTLQPIRRYGFDAAIIFSDILVIPDALGQEVRFEEGRGPVLEAVRDRGGLGRLSAEGVEQRLAPVYEAIAKVSAQLPAETALIGFCGAPWTIAAYMIEGGSSRDFLHAKRWTYADPEGFDGLMTMLVEACTRHLSRQIEAGAELVQIFDSWAGSLPPEAFERWCVEPVRAIVAKLRDIHPEVPVIGFPRGAGRRYAGYAERTGVAGVGIDTSESLTAISVPDGVALQGNLDPVLLVVGGDVMLRQVDEIRSSMSGRRFIFNLGHGVLPQTPPEHVAALVERVRR